MRKAVTAALAAEVLWLCKSGELSRIYATEVGFNRRSAVLDRLITHRVGRTHPNEFVQAVVHAHDHICSIALHMDRKRGEPEPAADATITIAWHAPDIPNGQP